MIPSEGIGWDVEALGIVKGSRNAGLARKVADWATTKNANELYARYYAVVAHPEVKNLPPNYPNGAQAKMIKMDFDEMAAQREKVVGEWSRRYDEKAAARK